MAENDICKTGIIGLDKILDGGIPIGDSILMAGSSGTGKSILSLEILFRGAKEFGDNGVYISFTEPRNKMIRNIKKFGFYDGDIIKRGSVRLLDSNVAPKLRLSPSLMNSKGLSILVYEVAQETGAERLVIDSITSLCQHLKDRSEIRKFLFRLGEKMMDMKCTTFLISETPPTKFQYSVFGVEEFISDGIIFLSEYEYENSLERTLQVIKMRGVAHSRVKHGMIITREGIVLTPIIK